MKANCGSGRKPLCRLCAMEQHNMAACSAFRLRFAMNELKRSCPPLWRFAELNMQCQNFEHKMLGRKASLHIVDEITRSQPGRICLTCRHLKIKHLSEAECYNPKSDRGAIKPWTTCEFWESGQM